MIIVIIIMMMMMMMRIIIIIIINSKILLSVSSNTVHLDADLGLLQHARWSTL